MNFHNYSISYIDLFIIVLLILSFISGYRKGFLRSLFDLFSLIIAIIISYILKNKISILLYKNFPFINTFGLLKKAPIINIILYELIAFITIFTIVQLIIKIISRITGLIDNILNSVFMTEKIGKVLGAIISSINGYIIIYFILFFTQYLVFFNNITINSFLQPHILNTPYLNKPFNDTRIVLKEIKETINDNTKSESEYNYKTLDILLKHKVITKENTLFLINSKKINIKNYQELLEKY